MKRKVVELFETAKRELHGEPDDSPKAPALRALVREREGLEVFLDSPPIYPAGEERLAQTLAQELENDPLPPGNRPPVRPRDRKLTINQGATREPNVYACVTRGLLGATR